MQIKDNEQLISFIQSAPMGVCVLDSATLTAELLNEKYLEITGKTRESIIGNYHWEPFAETRPLYKAAIKNVIETGEPYRAEEVEMMLVRDGLEEKIFVSFVYTPIIDQKGEISKIAVWVSDNTQQVKERRTVSASEARLNALVAATSDVTYSLSADWEIMRELDGRGFLKNTSEPIREWRLRNIYPDDLDKVNAAINEAIRDKKIFELEHRVVRADGSPGWTFSRAVPILDAQGEITEWFGMASNITERKEAAEALRVAKEQSEQQKRVYETITSGTPDLMYVWDLNYRFTYANTALLTMWGKTYEDAIGKTLLENGYEPWHAEMHERELDYIIATKDSVRGEVAFPHATLGKRIYDYILIPVLNEAGEVEAVAGTTRDITERKLWEERLEKFTGDLQLMNEEMAAANEELSTANEELIAVQNRLEEINRELVSSASRLRMAIETTNLGTWEYNPQSGELFWSKECSDVYGIPEGEMPTFDIFADHIYPADRERVLKAIEHAMDPAGDGKYNMTYRIIRFVNNETRWIKAHGNVFFENGLAVQFIGTVLDINELMEAEEKNAKLASIVASSDDAIISMTMQGEITSWNAGAERIFYYTADEMIGQNIYKLIPTDRQDEEPRILSQLREGKRIQHFETKRVRKDGGLIDVSLTISPVYDSEGKVSGISKIARDITQKKQEETRKNDFIGMVSHELKTPLTSLGGIIQVANAKLKNNEDPFLAGAMEKATNQVKRMTAMINGFLNISRLESGKILIEKQKFDITSLISDTTEEVRLISGSHQINFDGCKAPLEVYADKEKIGSVISNYINNAIKYSPKNSRITIACNADDNRVVVSVKDEGLGIEPHDLKKIFDRYYRVQTNQTRHIAGFGIGLYLSSEIIQHHGGSVWTESEPGKGSTFYFSLPL